MKSNLVVLLVFSMILFTVASVFAAPAPVRTGIGMHIGGYGKPVCNNKLDSCGTWPNCLDLRGVKWCVNEKVVEAYCFNNKAKNLTHSSQSCQASDFPNYQPLVLLLNASNGAGAKRIIFLTLFKPGTSETITALSINGSGYVPSTLPLVDFKFDYDNSGLSALVKSIDLTKISGSEIQVEKVAPVIYGLVIYKSYKVELPQSFTFSSITLKIKFDDSSVSNPNNLGIYRCESFDIPTNTCLGNWTKLENVTIDATNKIATVEINGFSVYSLGESQQQTTTTTSSTSTTTTTSTTTPTSSSTSTSTSSPPASPPPNLGGSSNPTTTTTSSTTQTTTQTTVNESENKTENTTTTTNQTKTSPVTGLVTALTANPAILLTPFAGIGAYFAWKSYLAKQEKEYKSPTYRSFKPAKFRSTKFKPMKRKKKESYTGETRLMLS